MLRYDIYISPSIFPPCPAPSAKKGNTNFSSFILSFIRINLQGASTSICVYPKLRPWPGSAQYNLVHPAMSQPCRQPPNGAGKCPEEEETKKGEVATPQALVCQILHRANGWDGVINLAPPWRWRRPCARPSLPATTDAAPHCNMSLDQSRYAIRAAPPHRHPRDELNARLHGSRAEFPCVPAPNYI